MKIPENIEEIIIDQKQGLTQDQLGEKYHKSNATIGKIFKEIGYSCLLEKEKVKKAKYLKQVMKLHQEGKSIRNIAKQFRIHNEMVARWLKEENYSYYELIKQKHLKNLIALHKQGKTIEELTRKFHLTHKTITNWFKEVKYNYLDKCASPNSFEIKCLEHLNKQYPNKFKYVGGSFKAIAGRSPDFISEELKTVVLANGKYWHCHPKLYAPDYFHKQIKKTAQQIWESDRRAVEAFEKAGYKVKTIWEHELVT